MKRTRWRKTLSKKSFPRRHFPKLVQVANWHHYHPHCCQRQSVSLGDEWTLFFDLERLQRGICGHLVSINLPLSCHLLYFPPWRRGRRQLLISQSLNHRRGGRATATLFIQNVKFIVNTIKVYLQLLLWLISGTHLAVLIWAAENGPFRSKRVI